MSDVQRSWAGILCATFCVVATVAASRPAGAAEIGVSDQQAAAFAHPLFGWAGIRTARTIAPWDAGLRPSPELAEWLEAARLRGVEPLVTFGHRRGEDCRVVRCHLPTPDEMRAAVRAFRARWPHVTTFGTWNEANHPGQPTAGRPGSAARLYEAILSECAGCTVVAIEVLDIDGMESWLDSFRRSLTFSTPRLWGLQNYGDVTRDRTTMTDRMMAAVPGDVWVTETGGIVRHVGADGQLRWPHDEERARASVARALALADRHAGRIKRVYFYQWQAGHGDLWDSGLMRPDGTPRPSFDEIARRLRPAGPPPVVQPEPDTAPDVPSHPRGSVVAVSAPGAGGRGDAPPALAFLDASGTEVLRLVRRPWLSRTGIVRARVSCPASRSSGCPARLAVRTRASASRAGQRGRLLGRDSVTVGAGRRETLAVRLREPDRDRLRRGRLRALVVEVAVPGGPRWRVTLRSRR